VRVQAGAGGAGRGLFQGQDSRAGAESGRDIGGAQR